MLDSVGVIATAIVIYFTGWAWVDSAVAVAIGLWVLPRTWTLLNESLNILLEGVPYGIDLNDVEASIREVDGVRGLHDLHVWAITTSRTSLSAHVLIDASAQAEAVRGEIEQRLARFGIRHTTMQCEEVHCGRNAHGPEDPLHGSAGPRSDGASAHSSH